ncbi:MAG: hypothetical protein A3J93_03360 [Candidatus Magasanikbacteria bacterium RIFOXYC2_FULL_42_28]|uniref:Addiction module toxin RelE n=1 Tax=Candidatus Magasanikbacteria bacterium RIFOXYC2_FULL_42_28 TaxID=1798704 RepID=A0A1F6NUE1_9BACT|nr:MAG: hypothetical protein A3J93_03360 [Candidatus Magasanikbacteria bacterium RIFOXYC2_FULL_42_28]
MEVKFFDQTLENFVDDLEKSTIAKVVRAIELLEHFGYKLGMPHSKKISVRLFELRIRGKQEVRIFYIYKDNEIVLLHGFVKKSDRIPEKELKLVNQKLMMVDKL